MEAVHRHRSPIIASITLILSYLAYLFNRACHALMMMSCSDDLGNVIMRFTESLFRLFVWLSAFVSCCLEDSAILNEIFSLFSSQLSQRTEFPAPQRSRCSICSVGLFDGLSGGSNEVQALMKVYYGHGNKPPKLEVERYRGANLHFFTLKCGKRDCGEEFLKCF